MYPRSFSPLHCTQMITPQMVAQQPRSGPVQSVQPVQPSSSFYQQPQPPQLSQTTGFFPSQQPSSTLQVGSLPFL